MAKANKTWDRFAKGYAKAPVADEASYQKKLDMTREILKPDMDVLEFGCGTGSTALAHAPYVKNIHAIDFSKKMITIAWKKGLADSVQNVDFMQFDFADYPIKGEVYDVVMGHSILHLLEDKEAAIAKAFTLLKPGGYFVSSTICMGGTKLLLQLVLPIGAYLGLLPVVKFFTTENLEKAVTDAGFTISQSWQPKKSAALFLIAQKPA